MLIQSGSVLIVQLLNMGPLKWLNTFWKENNTPDQMGDGTITTNHLFLSEFFSHFPFWFIVIRKEGKKYCSLGTFCSQKCGPWKGKCQPLLMVVPRTADYCVISYLNSGLNNTKGGHGAFHNPFTSFCTKVLLNTL